MKRQAHRKAVSSHRKPLENSILPSGVERLFTIREVAQLGARCRASLYVDIKCGRLKALKLGRSTRIRESDYLMYLENAPTL
jgi:predicted DNA-binding transcriptional regulator AlpA